MDVITNTEEGAEGAGYGEWKGCEVECQEKKALETVSFSHDKSYQQTVISSANSAKVLKN